MQSLRAKIILTFSGLVALNLVATFWSIYNFYTLGNTVATAVRENYQGVLAAENMVTALGRLESSLLLAAEGEDTVAVVGTYQENAELFVSWLDQAFRRLTLPQDVELRDSIQATYRRYAQAAQVMRAMIAQGAVGEAREYYARRVREPGVRLRDLSFRVFDANQRAISAAETTTRSLANQTAFGVLMASIVALGMSIIATVWLTKSVIEPAERLTETVRQIGRGKLDLKIDVLSGDEIGQLSREFNKMTERLRQYEQMNIDQILAEKRKSEAIVASMTDGIIVTDGRGRIMHVNGVVAGLFGIDAAKSAGAPVAQVIPDARIREMLERHGHGRATGKDAAVRTLEFERDGKTLFFRPAVSMIAAGEGTANGVLLILQDVTQFKELDRMKSEFIATLSHEFRTPVTSIGMSVDILNRGILGPLNDRQKELIDAARQDCVRLTKLARELLQLSKLESGRAQLRNEELDPAVAIEQILRPLQVQFSEKGVSLDMDLSASLPHLIADEQALASVLTNLATNALKHTDPGGTVVVRACEDDGALLVTVRDSGHGIPAEHLASIFDRFVQVKQSSESTPGSVGLGLAIAKEIVEGYGGTIWAESEPGRGSSFHVRLPALARQTAGGA
jgi:PAS domain S-box-containing protein